MGGRGSDICAGGTTRQNDGEWLRHWLGNLTGVYFTYEKPIFAKASKNWKWQYQLTCFVDDTWHILTSTHPVAL